MYYIIEHQIRADGQINVTETGRSTFATALSLYHERYSKMIVNETFPHVAIALVDQNLNIVERDDFDTQYKAPTPQESEQETEPVSES